MSKTFGFPCAQAPEAAPLQASFANGQIESELKAIFLEAFALVADDTFDASVLGAAHLGSFDLVRRATNRDGLVLLRGDREEAATRYLYRAWKSGDVQKRGLHFLRTYLQMLFPNVSEVAQLWHDKEMPYPRGAVEALKPKSWWLHQINEPGLKIDGTWKIGGFVEGATPDRGHRENPTEGLFLTSRIRISMDVGSDSRPTAAIRRIIRSVMPARLTPEFVYWIRFNSLYQTSAHYALLATLQSAAPSPRCGFRINSKSPKPWKVGIDGQYSKINGGLQLNDAWRLNEKTGRKSTAKIGSCAAAGHLLGNVSGSAKTWGVETLPAEHPPEYEPLPVPTKLGRFPMKINGDWVIGGGPYLGRFALNAGVRLPSRKMYRAAKIGAFTIVPENPEPVLKPKRPARLSINGSGWKINGPRNPHFDIEVVHV